MRKHEKLYNLKEDEIREEIKLRKKLRERREEREQLQKEIAQQEEATLECIEQIERASPSETLETLEIEILKDN